MDYHSIPHRVHHIRRRRAVYASASVLWYFAYGANLNLTHMRRHCIHAEPVATAELPDFRLVFRALADIEAWPGAVVLGAVWRIRMSDEAALDRFEGFPIAYRKEEHPVDGAHGEQVTAMLYRLNRGRQRPPNSSYLELIRQGYRDFGLPFTTLDAALERARRGKGQKRNGNW